jgi:hypothetical protein
LPPVLLFDYAVFYLQKNGGAMCLPSATFSTTIEKVADQLLIQGVKTAEFSDTHSFSIQSLPGLLGCKGGGHSVRSCAFVWIGVCTAPIMTSLFVL